MLRTIVIRASLLILLSGCASGRTLLFSSAEPGSEIALVPLASPESSGVKQRNPVTLSSKALAKQAVRISATGKAPIYWFAPGDTGRRLDIRVRQLPACQGNDGNRNRPLRLLLKAYQALTSKDLNLARELSTNASEIDPTLAAPHIITGLAFFEEGKKNEARIAFNKARALDPEDQEISELLNLVK